LAFEVARARALSDARNSDAGIAANIASYVVEKPRSRAQFRQSFTFAPFRAVIARIARRGFARRRDFARQSRRRIASSRTNPVAARGSAFARSSPPSSRTTATEIPSLAARAGGFRIASRRRLARGTRRVAVAAD
jgi:hypothetical protein